MNFVFVKAEGEPERDARARLPQTARPDAASACLIAAEESSGKVVGRALVVRQPIRARPPALPVAVHIDEKHHGTGIGAGLISLAEVQARAWDFKALTAWETFVCGSGQERRWQEWGFEYRPNLSHYVADLEVFHNLIAPLCARLKKRGRIPADAVVVSLSDAPLEPVIRLKLAFLGGREGILRQRLCGMGPDPFHPTLSRVVLLDGAVLALSLCRINYDGLPIVESRVVDPSHRGNWSNVLLLDDAVRAGIDAGHKQVRFMGGQKHVDTHKLARRLGSGQGNLMEVYVRAVHRPVNVPPASR